MSEQLTLQINDRFIKADTTLDIGNHRLMITPPLDSDYWIMRVPLSDKQAVVAFPKFTTVGIGFQYEDDDWNVNLPYQCEAREIYNHIRRNKGDDSIPDESCVKAIEMLKVTISQMMTTGELQV